MCVFGEENFFEQQHTRPINITISSTPQIFRHNLTPARKAKVIQHSASNNIEVQNRATPSPAIFDMIAIVSQCSATVE